MLDYVRHDVHKISIHAPRTGSDAIVWNSCVSMAISIHAPRTGSDLRTLGLGDLIVEFQSTLPARGATSFDARTRAAQAISIHAPRTGSDLMPR